MFEFIKKCFFTEMKFFSSSALNEILLKCVSVNNQKCKVRPEMLNINSNEPSSYPDSILVNKCSGSFNNINEPYAKLCIPNFLKNINFKDNKIIKSIKGVLWK